MTTIILPVFNNFELAEECLKRLCLYSGENQRTIVIDDASTEGNFKKVSSYAAKSNVEWLRNEKNLGFVGSVNRGFSLCRGEDVALVNSDVFVSKGWLELMREELYKSSLYGTVTAMATQGSVATVKIENRSLIDLDPHEVDELNEWLASQDKIVNPILPSAVGHCMLIKGSLTNLIGDLSPLFAPGYGEEVDFSLRANRYGFYHVLSTNVLVWHKNGASFGKNNPIKEEHEVILNERYHGYAEYVRTFEERSELISAAYMRIICRKFGINLLIDGRPLAGGLTGTARVIFEIQKQLRQLPHFADIDVLVPEGFNRNSIKDTFGINMISQNELEMKIRSIGKYDVVLRPSQVNSYPTLEALWDWGNRVIILQLDYISYHNWAYHFTVQQFREFQDSNLAALLICDGILFNSEFVYQESMHLGSQRVLGRDTTICNNGVDHIVNKPYRANQKNLVLILGVAFTHKNREYALKLLSKLKEKESGIKFIFVGSFPDVGGSKESERLLLDDVPELKECTDFRPWLDSDELEQLWDSVDLLLYPSISEGFGLVPLEAGRRGVPAIFAHETSLVYTGEKAPFFISFRDVERDAENVKKLIFDDFSRRAQVSYLKRISEEYTWDKTVRVVDELIVNAIALPPRIRKVHLERIFQRSIRRESFLSIAIRNPIVQRVLPVGTNRRRLVKKIYRLQQSLFGRT